jgi:hypothetical protein
MHLQAAWFVFWEWWSGFTESGSQDLANGTSVASQLANLFSVFTSMVYVLVYSSDDLPFADLFKRKWNYGFRELMSWWKYRRVRMKPPWVKIHVPMTNPRKSTSLLSSQLRNCSRAGDLFFLYFCCQVSKRPSTDAEYHRCSIIPNSCTRLYVFCTVPLGVRGHIAKCSFRL